MSETSTEVATQTQTRVELAQPSLYKIIYINDSQTSMQFVIDSLTDYFGYSAVAAETITEDIHAEGSAIVAVLPYEIAEQKGIEVTVSARSQGYPLQIKLEEDNA
jgi:ATP-dependent Clp protease adaptor protein ClpS